MGRVLLHCQPGLPRLLAGLPGLERVVPVDQPPPPCDLHLPLLSLPHVMGLNQGGIQGAPYLRLPPGETAEPRRDGRLAVGFVWQGSPVYGGNAWRNLPLEALRPAMELPGLRAVSLQMGPAAEEARAVPGLEDGTIGLCDLADTACRLAGLDLLVSCDTAVLHLAGALGLPAWGLLGWPSDFRWGLGRETTPWYDSLRLIRRQPGEPWAGLGARLACRLAALADTWTPPP